VTGYHEVKTFTYYPESSVPLRLPDGWKPFAAYIGFTERGANRISLQVVARRWYRSEPDQSE